ncbi:hypothetical protein A1Q2_00104 [Trichosporon asahii var. asahii CBS 8904]|uniref:Uncharacterized protein n=1 Tax=Trichosporon asahii var. asahii (strain CBS 8904) TaxID=1220162 RepID=K1WY92_TRIAC|nr:hypothetical protein A1Q2_00104 [Trichosporon asahii var. asahii CBS 8904]
MTSPLHASAYPHILENILGHLQADGLYSTLADCRLTSSAVKRLIDRRLPRRTLVCCHPGFASDSLDDLDSFEEALEVTGLCPRDTAFFKANTLMWNINTEGWVASPIGQVVDVVPPSEAQPCCSGVPWLGVESLPVVRYFGRHHHQGSLSIADTAIYFPTPTKKQHCHIELPKTARRVAINMRYEPGRCPNDISVGYTGPIPLESRGIHGWVKVDQELVIMFTPMAGAPCFDNDHIGGVVFNVTSAMFYNFGLQVVLLAEEWDTNWLAGRLSIESSKITDNLERFRAWWFELADHSIQRNKDKVPEESYRKRVKFMSKAEYEAQIGSRMFHLMLSE